LGAGVGMVRTLSILGFIRVLRRRKPFSISWPGENHYAKQRREGVLDGGYAGTAGKLKKFRLAPGRHNIELRDTTGKILYGERVTVISGKTVDINADLIPQKK